MRRCLLLSVLLAACAEPSARPQWTVVIATDAPVPQLGDRLLVEVLDSNGAEACASCTRVLPAGDGRAWPISFGVALPADGGEVRVRARLHRSDHVGFDGAPIGRALLDGLGRLPPTTELARVSLILAMDCFGQPSDPIAGLSCDPALRGPSEAPVLARIEDDAQLPAPGSWPDAQPVDCAAPVPEDMVCVPGGVFLLGDVHAFPTAAPKQSGPERLVRLSPFALDRDEVTVGAVRQLVREGALTSQPAPRGPDPKAVDGACFYLGPDDPSNDGYAVNCLSQLQAAEVCAALGKRLPTEAEWEWAAGNLGEESPYPWGHEREVCERAVVGLGRFIEAYEPEPIGCREVDGMLLPWGPTVGGHPADVTQLGIRNMAGNMSEWCADRLASLDDPCWGEGNPAIVDPRCDAVSARGSVRGSSWGGFEASARAGARDGSIFSTNTIGLRCARDGS